MKFSTAIFCVLILLIVGCKDNFETFYSCDPIVDTYVKENIIELSSLDLQDLNSYPNNIQRAIYRSYTPEKKCALWIERLNTILDNENWTMSETTHIILLIDYLCPEVFSSDITKLIDKGIDVYFPENWLKFGYDNIKWDKSKIAYITSSLETSYSDFFNATNEINKLSEIALANSETCNCNQSVDNCYPGECLGTECDKTNSGCGWLWLDTCDGTCLLKE